LSPRGRLLVLGFGSLAALPIAVAAVYAVVQHWTPIGDDAFIGIRAYDVFTGRSPLVGQRSSGASDVLSETVYSPGPLLFWLLAIPVRLPDPIFMTLTTGAVNMASIAGTVALARRRGGWALAVATAVLIPVMLASLPAETYADVWNSSAPLMPLLLLVFLAWSVACGEYRLLPLAVLVASFAVQAHLAFVAPVAGVMAVALVVALALGPARRWPRGWVLASLAVGIVCWSAPLADQVFNSPGNLRTLIRSAGDGDETIGWDSGLRAVVHTIGIRPWWLQDDRGTLQRIGDLTQRPSAIAYLSAAALLALLATLAAIGWHRRRADLAAAGALGLVLSLSAGLAASSTPVKSFGTVGYTLRWTSPVGMCVWLLAGWGVATVLGPRLQLPAPRATAAGAAALIMVAVVAIAVTVGENPPRRESYKPMRSLNHALETQLPATGGTRVQPSGALEGLGLTNELEAGTVFWLRRHGRRVVTTRNVAERTNPEYAKGPYDRLLRLFVDVPPIQGGRSIARFQVLDEVDQKTVHDVAVTVSPGARPGSDASR
jgi:hypothetical protein